MLVDHYWFMAQTSNQKICVHPVINHGTDSIRVCTEQKVLRLTNPASGLAFEMPPPSKVPQTCFWSHCLLQSLFQQA